jgi:hypothetical protein
LASDGYEQSTLCPGRCTTWKEFWYPLNGRLGAPQSWSGLVAEVKYPLHLLEFKPQTIELTDNELLIKCLLFTNDVSTVIATVLHFPFHALQFNSFTIQANKCTQLY